MTVPRHFLDLDHVDAVTLRGILDDAAVRKQHRSCTGRVAPDDDSPLTGRLLAMVFENPSTRTRVSFYVAMRQMGGEAIDLVGRDTQIGRGESAADTARVLSRYADAIMVRTNTHADLSEMADAASVPVINGLTDHTHPCQVMADVLTIEEKRGSIAGKVLAWCGAGNNMSHSWIHASARFDFELHLACPDGLGPDPKIVAWARREGATVVLDSDANEVVKGADVVMTDTWVSMNDHDEKRLRSLLRPYQITRERMSLANADALFLHCLPAHRGEEVTAEVIDSPRSAVWDEAENRIHVQKAILAWCLV